MTALPRLSDLDNRTVLVLAAKSGKPRAPSKAEKHRTCQLTAVYVRHRKTEPTVVAARQDRPLQLTPSAKASPPSPPRPSRPPAPPSPPQIGPLLLIRARGSDRGSLRADSRSAFAGRRLWHLPCSVSGLAVITQRGIQLRSRAVIPSNGLNNGNCSPAGQQSQDSAPPLHHERDRGSKEGRIVD